MYCTKIIFLIPFFPKTFESMEMSIWSTLARDLESTVKTRCLLFFVVVLAFFFLQILDFFQGEGMYEDVLLLHLTSVLVITELQRRTDVQRAPTISQGLREPCIAVVKPIGHIHADWVELQ